MSVLIIGEAGVNHNGDVNIAKKLIDVAVLAGVDYVKFQTFNSEKLASKSAKKASYQIQNSKNLEESQFDMLKKLELSQNEHQVLISYCREKNIKFLSTAFDLESLSYLSNLGLTIAKIPSGEITNLPYLKHAARLFPQIILSTGMATINEIRNAVTTLYNCGVLKENITILHCNTAYPTPIQDVNLKAMLHIEEKFGTKIGYSDHTLGIEVSIAAVALGAQIIEKHFTLDKNMEGPDHQASLEPDELKSLVSAIRNIDIAISGTGLKEPSPSEMKNVAVARKSIHLINGVSKGEIIYESNMEMLRPGDGISPMLLDSIVGKKAKRNLKGGTKLSFTDFI